MEIHEIKLAILLKVEKILFDAIQILNTPLLIREYENPETLATYEKGLKKFGLIQPRKSMRTIQTSLGNILQNIQTKIKNPEQYQKAQINLQGSNIAFNPQAVLRPSQMISPGFYTTTIPSRVRGAPSPKRNLKPKKSPPKVSKYLERKEEELCNQYKADEKEVFSLHKQWRQQISRGNSEYAAEINKEKMKLLEEMGRLAKFCKRSAERSPKRHGNASPDITISALQRKETLTKKEQEILQRRLAKQQEELVKFLPKYILQRETEKLIPSYIPISEKTFIRNLQKPSPSVYGFDEGELEFIPKAWSANKFVRNPLYKIPSPF